MTDSVTIWGIVGSRGYSPLTDAQAFVSNLPPGSVVVSGGARGVDQAAEEAARERGFTVRSWRPIKVDGVWRVQVLTTSGRGGRGVELLERTFPNFPSAAHWRNGKIVKSSDRVRAFWDGRSTGTADTMKKARKADKLDQSELGQGG